MNIDTWSSLVSQVFLHRLLKPEKSLVFCKIRQQKGLWIAWIKRLGSFVKLKFKNSVSNLDILNTCQCLRLIYLRTTILILPWNPRDWKILVKISLLNSSIKSFCQFVNPYIRRSLSMLVFYIVEHVRFFILISSSLPYPQLEERPSCSHENKVTLSHLFVLGKLFICTEFAFYEIFAFQLLWLLSFRPTCPCV